MSNSSSPAHPSQASTATTTAALQGTTTTITNASSVSTSSSFSFDDFNFSADALTAQDRKDKALRVMKSDLMASLNKEVKSLDEDSWMFDGPQQSILQLNRVFSSFIDNDWKSVAQDQKHYELLKAPTRTLCEN